MKLKKHTQARIRLLSKSLIAYGKKPELETLHQIRLEVKKIKAILQLANASRRGFRAHKYFIPFRTIFRKAGEIREPEILYGLLLRYEIEGINDSLISPEGDGSTLALKFRKRIPFFIKSVKACFHKMEGDLKKVDGSDLRKYVKAKRKDLQLMLKPEWEHDTLHKARKVCKEIIYLSAITRKTKTKLDPFYHELEEAIGHWHDKQMIIPLLKKVNSAELNRLMLACQQDEEYISELKSDFYSVRGKEVKQHE